MIISHRRRFVILAPWKTASSTIRARLGTLCESPYSAFYHLNPDLGRVVHQHLTLADFAELPESRLGYRTAAFVRNPYDRVYSGFHQLIRDVSHQPRADFPDEEVRALVMMQLAENYAHLGRAEFAFEAWLALLQERQVEDAGRNSSFPLHPANYWTHRDGRQEVDFIGRVESFETDFDRLCAELGVEADSRANANVSARESELAGDEHGYRYAARMSSGARRKVNELFREDFALFGYEQLT